MLTPVQMAAWEFQSLQNIAKQNGWHQFISMQDYYSLLYRENEREMIPYCRDTGVGIITACAGPAHSPIWLATNDPAEGGYIQRVSVGGDYEHRHRDYWACGRACPTEGRQYGDRHAGLVYCERSNPNCWTRKYRQSQSDSRGPCSDEDWASSEG